MDANILLKEIEKYSDKYKFSFQFWGEGDNNVYISKANIDIDIDLFSTGGLYTIKDALISALNWVYKVNRVPKAKRLTN